MNINTSGLQIPKNWKRFKTIDMHTGGEPLRVIVEGLPKLKCNSVLEYRSTLKNKYDFIRKLLMWEPRGHADMYGCILVPPNDEGADFGIVFLHNEGYSTMCGHATIAIAKLAVDMRWVEVVASETKVVIDAPCGRLVAYVQVENGEAKEVRFECVPSYVVALNQSVFIEGIGEIVYDLAYGGAYYAYVDAFQLGLDLTPENYFEQIQLGMRIKKKVMDTVQIQHPFESDLSFLYGTIFIGDPISKGVDSRNVCVFAEGEVDRCPTGSGISGRMAIHYQKNEIGLNESMRIESITGSVFSGKVNKELSFGGHKAVVPEVSGRAFLTGVHDFFVDPNDLFQEGFFLR